MRHTFNFSRALAALGAVFLLASCEPSVILTASWSNTNVQPASFSRLLVVAFGQDLGKRKLGEDYVKAELHRHGLTAVTSLDEFGPDFARTDSASMQQLLLDRRFDGVITIRVLNVNEHDRWVPGDVYYGPVAFYRSFYGYYYRVWGYYHTPGYTVTDVEVLLESNFYRTSNGELLWSGQSKAFDRDPSGVTAATYARNIVKDMIRKGVLITPQ
jgi:hypothetical protein